MLQPSPKPRRILLLGATGTIGRATARALADKGHSLTCLTRNAPAEPSHQPKITYRTCNVLDPGSLRADGIAGDRFDALVSCLASRTGRAADAWAIDHRAHVDAMTAAKDAGVTHIVLLSAICVQKPLLAFQHAKLAFEAALIASGLTYSIVRPTAFFKSLSGQVERVKRGKPFLVFGDGRLTQTKPISDRDLARFIADTLDTQTQQNKILPIGGPGPAITPLDQAEALFALLGQKPRIKRVPVALINGIADTLGALSRIIPPLADKAEFARIGRYYATESMLVLNPETGHYDASATPSFGSDTLAEHYRQLIEGQAKHDLGEHAVF